jgi:RNA polymerase sigma factor (sigma-70 family)
VSDHNPANADPPASAAPALDERSRARCAVDEEFSAFYRSTVQKLTGFLIHQGAALPVAADIAQETMIKAYRRWSEIRQPQAWVRTVASRALVRKVADIREDSVEQVPEPTSLLPRPDAFAEWEVRHDALRIAQSLPPRQRQIFAWTLSGFDPSEIAEELGLTPEAVRASLMKARRTVAGHLKEREEQ